jgi:hypothetical protein
MSLFFFRGLGFSTIDIILLIVIHHRQQSSAFLFTPSLLVTFELGLVVEHSIDDRPRSIDDLLLST